MADEPAIHVEPGSPHDQPAHSCDGGFLAGSESVLVPQPLLLLGNGGLEKPRLVCRRRVVLSGEALSDVASWNHV